MKSKIKSLLCCAVSLGFSSAFAGSYDDFFIAVRNDNASQIRALIQQGFDVNTRDPKGQPGLTIALKEKSPKAVRALLEVPGVEIDAANQADETPLMIAAIKGDLVDAKALLERGAQVNRSGWTPLHYAVSGPDPKLAALLLDHGAEINAPSPNGTTPLMMAAQYGSEDSVNLLLQRGADPKLLNQQQLGAADFARIAQRQSLATQLDKLQH